MRNITREIIVKAARGDIDAFEEIFKTYADYVFNVALRVTRHEQDAEEIVQEVFMKIYRKLNGFRFGSSLDTWIYRITVNMAINYEKRNMRAGKNTFAYNDDILSLRSGNNVNANIEREYNENLIGTLLDALTFEQRVCVVLRSMEGMSYKEIARVLKINLNTVRSRLKRARVKLLALKKEVINDGL